MHPSRYLSRALRLLRKRTKATTNGINLLLLSEDCLVGYRSTFSLSTAVNSYDSISRE